jgi:hypothetical protein
VQTWEHLVRIVTCPTPFVYRHLVALLVFLFVFTFPFAYVQTLGVVIVPATCIVCLGYYGVSELAQELENPLGFDANDVDLRGLQDIMVAELHATFRYKFGEDLVTEDDVAGDTNGGGIVAKRDVFLIDTIAEGVPPPAPTLMSPKRSMIMHSGGGAAFGIGGGAVLGVGGGAVLGVGGGDVTIPVRRDPNAIVELQPPLLPPGLRMPGGGLPKTMSKRGPGSTSTDSSGAPPVLPGAATPLQVPGRGPLPLAATSVGAICTTSAVSVVVPPCCHTAQPRLRDCLRGHRRRSPPAHSAPTRCTISCVLVRRVLLAPTW